MDGFGERLQAAADAYRGLQSHLDGGWTEDRTDDAARSIVNTTEVLTVLRVAGLSYDDSAVQRGLAYLAHKVFTHPRSPSADPVEGRGPRTRYLAWGLRGLVLWPAARQDPRWHDAQAHCVAWLAEHELVRPIEGARPIGGGWGEDPRQQHPSMLSTQMAVEALGRVAVDTDVAFQMAARARAEVARMGATAAGTTSWPQAPGERFPSPAATALAVLTLTSGTSEQRARAYGGVRWLMAHVDRWATTLEGDGQARGSNWAHMTFSLGLRAVLIPGSAVAAETPALRPAIDLLSDLWIPAAGEWSHGKPGARPSPSGSCAVVLAHEALKRAWSFDAERHLVQRRISRRKPAPLPKRFEVRLDEKADVSVFDFDEELLVTRALGPSLSQFMAVLAVRHREGEARAIESRALPTDELCRLLAIRPDTVRTYAKRVNKTLKEAAAARDRHLGDLVQDKSAEVASMRAWYLNVDLVVVAPEVVHTVNVLRGGGQPSVLSTDGHPPSSADRRVPAIPD